MGLPHGADELGAEGDHRSSPTRAQSHRTWAGRNGDTGRVHQQSRTSQSDEPDLGGPAGREQQEMAQKQGYGIGPVLIQGTWYKATTLVSLGSLQENHHSCDAAQARVERELLDEWAEEMWVEVSGELGQGFS